jgi:hypothetical protein
MALKSARGGGVFVFKCVRGLCGGNELGLGGLNVEGVGQLRCQIRFFVDSGFQSMRAEAIDSDD